MEGGKREDEVNGEGEEKGMLEKILRRKWGERPMGGSKMDKERVENQGSCEDSTRLG